MRAPLLLSTALFLLFPQTTRSADTTFIPKPSPTDKSIGSTLSSPTLKFGNTVFQTNSLLVSKTGGISKWVRHADGRGDVIAVTADEQTGALMENKAKIEPGTEVNDAFLKQTAWFLIQRYPDKPFTSKFLKHYFDIKLPQHMSEEELAELGGGATALAVITSKNSHGSGLNIPGLGRGVATGATEPTFEQLKSFFANPYAWVEGTCTEKGCTMEHKPEPGAPNQGAMVASKGMKALALHAEDADTPSGTTNKPAAQAAAGKKGPIEKTKVSSQQEFEQSFKQAPEENALVIFSADNCGPCKTLHSMLESGAKVAPPNTKVYVVQVPSYSWSSVPAAVQSFKGGGGFPQIVKFTKTKDGKLQRSNFPAGDTSAF